MAQHCRHPWKFEPRNDPNTQERCCWCHQIMFIEKFPIVDHGTGLPPGGFHAFRLTPLDAVCPIDEDARAEHMAEQQKLYDQALAGLEERLSAMVSVDG